MIELQKFWYAVYTFSRSEKKFAEQLSKKGMNYYLPLISVKRQWSDRIKTIQLPVFTSYVFVKIDIQSEKIKVLETPGAHHIVSISGVPHAIPDEDLEFIRELVREFPDKVRIEREQMLQPGKKVKISRGMLKGKAAQVIRKGNQRSIRVSILGIDSTMYVDVDQDYLEIGEEK